MLLNEVFGWVGPMVGDSRLVGTGLRADETADDDEETTFDDVTSEVVVNLGAAVTGLGLFVRLSVGRVVEFAEVVVDTAEPAAADAKASDLSAAAAARRFRFAATCSIFKFFLSLGGDPGFVLLDGLLFGGVGDLASILIGTVVGGVGGFGGAKDDRPILVGDVGEVDERAGLLVILLSIGICGSCCGCGCC